MPHYLLAIDQGTTNSRAIIYTEKGELVAQHEMLLKQFFPESGWVEQYPEEIWENTLACCRNAMKKIKISAQEIAAIGISNQRETTIMWDRKTGKTIYPAIVWQDRRTAELCNKIAQSAISKQIPSKTGLLIDPYFSATKIMWLLENIPQARERAEKGDLVFGTVDTYLLWRLTGGKSHATDATNASRTMLFNIRTQQWDDEILAALNIPKIILPNVLDNSADFGLVEKELLGGSIPIAGMAGDQQAATVGQACFHKGMIKSTYGTGCFMLLNTGSKIIESNNQLLATIAYRLQGDVVYGLEGSIFSAGVIVKWLRDHMKFIKTAAETESCARKVTNTEGVYLVPGFTGLGAPYWDPAARGAILGLTSNSSVDHIVRAGLESIGYQTRDLLQAMKNDSGTDFEVLRVDGGMVANNWLLQFLADILNVEVQRPVCIETSALGAVFLAGLQVGIYQSLDQISRLWQASASFTPEMSITEREKLYAGWQQSVTRVLTKSS
jgi:glycerol kinase